MWPWLWSRIWKRPLAAGRCRRRSDPARCNGTAFMIRASRGQGARAKQRFIMIARTILTLASAVLPLVGMLDHAQAQDVPGIEICTVEKTMERRTSCLQSNVNFLQQTLGKLRLDQQQRLDAANRQVEALTATVVTLQRAVTDLQAGKKPASAPATPGPAVKDAPVAKEVP